MHIMVLRTPSTSVTDAVLFTSQEDGSKWKYRSLNPPTVDAVQYVKH